MRYVEKCSCYFAPPSCMLIHFLISSFAQGSELNWCQVFFHNAVTLVLATDRDQVFHWWRGTTLRHSPPVNRRTRKNHNQLPHSCQETKCFDQQTCCSLRVKPLHLPVLTFSKCCTILQVSCIFFFKAFLHCAAESGKTEKLHKHSICLLSVKFT